MSDERADPQIQPDKPPRAADHGLVNEPSGDTEGNVRRRREAAEEQSAADGDGLAEATHGVQSGLGLGDPDNSADGEDATEG